MISDNFVTGDNIYLRELQNFFFEVLGMMSITHYGAVGDGRVDNYGPLQVAIDDAHRRGLSFLYVPYGRFIYTGELHGHIDEETGKETIIFMGNPHAHIVNIRTGEEITIHQFGWLSDFFYNKEESDDRFVNIDGDKMTGSLAIGPLSYASGNLSFAQGVGAVASGECSNATGIGQATGDYSHAEGVGTKATAFTAHAEGNYTIASGMASHAEGQGEESDMTTASGTASHAEGGYTTASGSFSHAEGFDTTASGDEVQNAAHAEGCNTTASSQAAHAEGNGTIASGAASHAEGLQTQATRLCAHAGGVKSRATGYYSFAHGRNVEATMLGQFAIGVGNINEGEGQYANITATDGIFIVGNGTRIPDTYEIETRSNALRLTFGGDLYIAGTYTNSGADYAECFEWADGNPNNEDRTGRFAVIENNKIRLAVSGDKKELMGVITAFPTVLGDSFDSYWHGKYVTDVYGRIQYETVEVPEQEDIPAHTEKRPIISPEFDGTREYVSRAQRPEYGKFAMLGKLIVEDDGTCLAGEYCVPNDSGIATRNYEGFYVMERIDENHIRIFVR